MDIVPTWKRVARVWWAIAWRWAVVAGPGMMVWLFGLVTIAVVFELPDDVVMGPVFLSTAVVGVALLILPVKMVLGKAFKDFRLELTPNDEEADAREVAPGFTTVVIEGKRVGRHYPFPMLFHFNGEPMYKTVDLSMTGDLKVMTLDGEEVVRCAGKTVRGVYAMRLESTLEGDRPVVFRTDVGRLHFYVNDELSTIELYKRKQVVRVLNLEVTMGGTSIVAVGDKVDAAALSPPMLVGLLAFAHQLRRTAAG
jgi:hypothetical protein